MIHTDMESVKYLANEIFEKLISVILTKWFINKKNKKTMAVIYVFVRFEWGLHFYMKFHRVFSV